MNQKGNIAKQYASGRIFLEHSNSRAESSVARRGMPDRIAARAALLFVLLGCCGWAGSFASHSSGSDLHIGTATLYFSHGPVPGSCSRHGCCKKETPEFVRIVGCLQMGIAFHAKAPIDFLRELAAISG